MTATTTIQTINNTQMRLRDIYHNVSNLWSSLFLSDRSRKSSSLTCLQWSWICWLSLYCLISLMLDELAQRCSIAQSDGLRPPCDAFPHRSPSRHRRKVVMRRRSRSSPASGWLRGSRASEGPLWRVGDDDDGVTAHAGCLRLGDESPLQV